MKILIYSESYPTRLPRLTVMDVRTFLTPLENFDYL